MSQKYRVVFIGLQSTTSAEEVVTTLSSKLNIAPQKVEAFLAKKPLFAPAEQSKSLKQVKLLERMGVKAKLVAVEPPADTSPQSQKDERVFEALDYITSSLIRIEERLEEIEHRLGNSSDEDKDDSKPDSWHEDELFEELDLDLEPVKKIPTRKLQYTLAAILIVLLTVLALAIIYPQWFNL
ncbi:MULTISPECIES: hypothetical protein [Pseudoalteromonas]|uniref:Uncharacterized protein n=1 Tax=Pseudoalteromonas amylolytica TaxID=1859457 RepID=A0A1S1MY68_9GAMM|nr:MULTISPECIES: hypothetical protein [Pseudoalteromonas]OHU88570.1 hypothetical protein BFC16_07745 [Pseudoalteromonas sp. JW3]OHU90412.1 hypothetical protein BET10_13580 [Pseudoalteromonas amylolytica]